MFAFSGDSTVRGVVAPAAMLKQKPNLFALNEDGSRNPYLPNLTNPEAVKIAADVIRASLAKIRRQTLTVLLPTMVIPATSTRNDQAEPRFYSARRPAGRSRRGEHHRGMADVRQQRDRRSPQGVSATRTSPPTATPTAICRRWA